MPIRHKAAMKPVDPNTEVRQSLPSPVTLRKLRLDPWGIFIYINIIHHIPSIFPWSSIRFPEIHHQKLVGGFYITILKNMSSSLGMIIPYMKWKITFMFETFWNHQPVIHQKSNQSSTQSSPQWVPPPPVLLPELHLKPVSTSERPCLDPGLWPWKLTTVNVPEFWGKWW